MPYNPSDTPESHFLTDDECRTMNPVLHSTRDDAPYSAPPPFVLLDREQIAALNADVVAADRAVAEAHARRAEVRTRRQGLETRLADERAAEPPELPALDPSLVDALASDPAAECCSDAVTDAAKRHFSYRAASDTWRTRVELVRQAIGKVDGEAADLDAQITVLNAVREQSWEAFLTAAHGYLLAEFQARFAALRDDFLDPLVDMQRMTVPNLTPEGHLSLGTRSLISYGWTRLDRRSAIMVDRAVPESERALGRPSVQATTLFEYPHASINNLLPTKAIDRFRASLPTTG